MPSHSVAQLTRAFMTAFAAVSLAAALGNAASAAQHNTVHDFCSQRNCSDGRDPNGPVLRDGAGALFGVTSGGGLHGDGVVYRVAREPKSGKWRSKRIHSFCAKENCTDGFSPAGNLIVDVDGNLYGVARGGGRFGCGDVYMLSPNGGGYKMRILHHFSCATEDGDSDGDGPAGGLTYAGAASGLPYDGISPLYGTTFRGGYGNSDDLSGGGTVYQLTPSNDTARAGGGMTETILYSFCSLSECTDGQHPASALIVDGSGALYGTTADGGNGHGVVFVLRPSEQARARPNQAAWNESVLHTFCSQTRCADGGYNFGTPRFGGLSDALVMDGEGNLFGATPGGGSVKRGCCGVIFKIAPPNAPAGRGGQLPYSVVYSFCALNNCADGATPNGSLLLDAAGNLFGTTQTGGGNNIDAGQLGGGTVFRLSGGTLTTLYAFCAGGNCLDGTYPWAGLATDGRRALYGTTIEGGVGTVSESTGDGTVFEIVK